MILLYDYSRQIYELLNKYLPEISGKLDELTDLSSKLSGIYPLILIIVICLLLDRVLRKGDMM